MPCVSLKHRKIYQETVAPRIAARRLSRATEKATTKTAKKTEKAAAKAIKKAVKQSRKHSRKSRYTPVPQASAPVFAPFQAPSTPSVSQPLVAQPTPSDTPPRPARPRVQFISSTLQEFEEGVEVRVLHAKPRISVIANSTNSDLSTAESAYIAPYATTSSYVAPQATYHRFTRAELINAESSIGRTLFGPIPAGHRREFFHDRENVWIWYEGWTEMNREPRQMTIRYEVRPTGVYKKLSAGSYVALEGNELENFRRATHAYLYLIKRNLYHLA